MTPRHARRVLILTISLLVLALAAQGADEPSCQPVEPGQPVCLTALDCDGLVPDINCLGAWTCVEAACVWECGNSYCWSNDMCAEGEYCFFAVCAQETGACVPRPQACYYLYAPVCGCDGETYSNDCLAASAGVSVDYEGECEVAPGACWEDSMCAAGEFCQLAGCGAKSGDCVVIPEACYAVYKPVCGCDGKTYGNDCEAAAAHQTIAHEGACEG